MRGSHLVVPITDDQQRARAIDSSAEKFDQVERRVVGPVGVLNDDQHWHRGQTQLIEHGLE